MKSEFKSPLRALWDKKERGERIAMISLYDAPTAALCCEAGADCLLVGDSLGNVILGYENTIPVTLEDMARHTAAVARGARQSSRPDVPVIADMPFGSYHGSPDNIIGNGSTLMRAGAHGLKLEGAGPHVLKAIELLTQMGAPVVGHLGFTPQAALIFRSVVQGKTAEAAARLLRDAQRLQEAGCIALVLEVVPMEVTQSITQSLAIPTIGIGAGPHCAGQVLIWHELIGLTSGPPLRFVKRYADASAVLGQAVRDFVREVQSGEFPAREQGWAMPGDEFEKWQRMEKTAPPLLREEPGNKS